jgi:hypothetical protein
MNKFLDFKLFEEHHSRNTATVEALSKKCKELYELVEKWVFSYQTTADSKIDITKISDSGSSGSSGSFVSRNIEWWLGGLEDGKLKNLFSGETNEFIIKGLFMSHQGFFHISIDTDMYVRYSSGAGRGSVIDVYSKDRSGESHLITININLGHNGENLVVCVNSGHPSKTKDIEKSLKDYLIKTFDPEFKIGGLTLIEYIEKNKGRAAARKFGFDPKYNHE